MIDYNEESRGEPNRFSLYIGDRTFPMCVCVRVCNLYLRSLLVWRPTPMNDDGDRPERRETYFIVSRSLSSRQGNNNSKRVEKDDLLRRPNLIRRTGFFSPLV
jgi:hypothetical protein